MNFEKELQDLKPYIEKELQQPQYNGKTLEELREEAEQAATNQYYNSKAEPIAPLPPDVIAAHEEEAKSIDLWEQLINAARTTAKQQQGRNQRRDIKLAAQEDNAIMELKKGEYPLLSAADLWDAFSPGKILEIGTLNPSVIDQETGRINQYDFTKDELTIPKTALPIQGFLLLSAIQANSVENYFAEEVSAGDLTFYVKGVLDAMTEDPRGLLSKDVAEDGQLNIDRKTAGVLFLENLFKPLQNCVGTLPNGSRYTVLNYYGYNADNDTMTIRSPYIYELWRRTQARYFTRQENKKKAIKAGKAPKAEDEKSLEINRLFKDTAITEDPITLEIAIYITNHILGAGKNGKTELLFKTIVSGCPTLRNKIAEIEASDRKNKAAFINRSLQKIGNAIDLILTPEKCTATTEYRFKKIEPSKKLPGYKQSKGDIRKSHIQFIPPTKGKSNDKLVINYEKRTSKTE